MKKICNKESNRSLLEHYYPNGETLRAEIGQEKEGNQRIT